MILRTCTITLAGVSIDIAFDGTNYFVAIPTLEDALGERRNSTREKVVSESLKALLGKEIPLGKKRVGSSFVTFMLASDFTKYLGWLANQQHKVATALVVATALEALERRADVQLGATKTEEDYEASTRSFFRELSRKQFIPELSAWNDLGCNYGLFVNEFKRALRLPLESVDGYKMEEVQRWSKGITAYNTLRHEGAGHRYALAAVKRQQADI
jgi:hypothetical protein